MSGEKKEVRFVSARRDQLAGEVRNWLLDRLRDSHDARPWDQRPAEDQEMLIGQAEAFGINLVSDIADAIHESDDPVIRATIGKVTTDGSILKADITLPVDDGEADVHAMVDAAGKKVAIVVSDPADLTGTEGRPAVADDQGNLGLDPGDEEKFERIYLLYDQAECREEHLPLNSWEHLTVLHAGGASAEEDGPEWVHEEPTPTDENRFVLRAQRSVDLETVFDEATQQDVTRVTALGDWEPPTLSAELIDDPDNGQDEPATERLLCRYEADFLPKEHWPNNAWLFGLGGDANGVVWFVEAEFPDTDPEHPYCFEVKRLLDGLSAGPGPG